jgi:hypothetical protein
VRRAIASVSIGLMSVAIVALGGAQALAGSSKYPPRAATCAVAPAAGPAGTSVQLKGSNWGGGTVSITFEQDGTTAPLATATVSGSRYEGDGTIPGTASRGRATVVVTGTSVSGDAVTCTSNFNVIDPKHTSATIPAGGAPLSAATLILGIGALLAATALRRTRDRSRDAGAAGDVKR